MGVSFTRKAYLKLWRGDRYISQHISRDEAYESAINDAIAHESPGKYQVKVGSELYYEIDVGTFILGSGGTVQESPAPGPQVGPTTQELRDMGYLLVDDYGADPTGVSDSITAINNCIEDGRTQRRPVWFSAGATYRVTDTVRLGMWDSGDTLNIHGGRLGGGRPTIVLDDGATGFGNSSDPRPVVCLRLFPDATDGDWPSDPLDETSPYTGQANIVFYFEWFNINITTGANAGAVGMYAPGAQRCAMADVHINATGGYRGLWGALGRNSPVANLKITGGVQPLRNDSSSRSRESSAGSMIAGLEIVPEAATQVLIESDDPLPMVIVGFDIERSSSGNLVDVVSGSRTGYRSVVFIDGIFRSGGGTVVDNGGGKNIYLRNCYVTGTNDLVQSGSESTITAAGTWKRIDEYAYNDQSPDDISNGDYATESLINNVTSTAAEPATNVTASVAAPTVDFIDRHTADFPMVDEGPVENILDHGATPNPDTFSNIITNDNTADSLGAIHSAIAAAATAGHNRVLIPRGVFYVSDTVTLGVDTKFIGVGNRMSLVCPQGSWQPTSMAFVMETVNNAAATTHFSKAGFYTRTVDGTFTSPDGPYAFDWFSFMNWRAGRNSSSIQLYNGREFMAPTNRCQEKHYYHFEGNAGGKHYGMTDAQGRRFGDEDCRTHYFSGTSQPLHCYGVNPEITKRSVGVALTNIEIVNCANIRLYGIKREGESATLLINDSDNIAAYGLGRQVTDQGYVCRITGTSDGVLIAPCVHDDSGTSYDGTDMIRQDLDAESTFTVEFPGGCSYYRRGVIDDAAATI